MLKIPSLEGKKNESEFASHEYAKYIISKGCHKLNG